MSTSGIRPTSKGRRLALFNSPGFTSADHPWAGYSFEEATGNGEPMPSHSWAKTTLLYVTGGQASLRWKHRGIWRKDPCRTGTVSIIRRDVEIQSAVPSGPCPLMVMQLDNLKLQGIAPDHVRTIEKSLEPAQVTSDCRLGALLSAMLEEVRDGCPSGRLYGESISLALLAYLAGAYATPRPAEISEKGLSPAQKRCLVEYVRANLSANISVTELAELVQMSPSHFARMFKASFAMTPYQFVMRERVEGAKDLFAGTNSSAIEVAMAFGFASQSHFAKVFRQFTGVTPKQYRAGF